MGIKSRHTRHLILISTFGLFGFKGFRLAGNFYQTYLQRLLMELTKCALLSLTIATIVLFSSCSEKDAPAPSLELSDVRIGSYALDLNDASKNLAAPSNQLIVVSFSTALNRQTVEQHVQLKQKSNDALLTLSFSFQDNDRSFSAYTPDMVPNTTYVLVIPADVRGAQGGAFAGTVIEYTTAAPKLTVTSIKIANQEILNLQRPLNLPLDNLSFEITFSSALDPSTVIPDAFRITGFASVPTSVELTNEDKTVIVTASQKLSDLRSYTLRVTNNVKGAGGGSFDQYSKIFYTSTDPEPDFPLISDEALLTLVQQQTFKYFWDFAHPASGMARERNTSGDLVTSGGSGFGLMAIIVGIERNFITRSEGIARLATILSFLEGADRFHGAWSHWINGNTGKVIAFSANDNGGDLVETSFLVQGLLTFRQYLNPSVAAEKELIDRINALWETVEWSWYTRGGQQVLYWHWSPDKEWTMNHQIRGHNETLITYVLAASSPTHGIESSVYHNGYARNGAIRNGKTFYGITLPLGEDYGGPLFFSHYSFLGLDPRNLSDDYANYWEQNRNHTLINRAYAMDNPKNYAGYSDVSWGLTASDNNTGYSAHSPTNDLGVITPTAALSSFPYTPDESLQALKFFYYSIGDRLWGNYGFYDAYNITAGWTAPSYLAIDQGPIIVMIENHRTGLLWDLFMSAPEVQAGLTKLGFNY
jgi:hypothetical protein